MALNVNVTLKRLIAEIKEWSDDHKMIEGFGYGDFLDLYQEGENTYPYLMVNCSNAGSDKWYIKYQLEFGVMDWVWDDRENFQRVESDTMEIIRDFQNTVEESPRWQAFCKINGDITDRKFTEKGGDKVTGWGATINLWVKRRSGFCNLQAIMPEYDFQSGNVIIPTCAPGTFQNSDDSFSVEIASGGTFVSDDVINLINGVPQAAQPSNVGVDYPFTCLDADVTVNSDAFGSVASGDIIDVPVEFRNGTPTGSIESGIVKIENPVVALNTSDLFKTGAISFQTNDDGDLKQGRGVDFFTLDHLNKFGNTSRFTDDVGGQTYTSGIIVDWSTENQLSGKVLCYFQTLEPAANLTTMIDNQPFTKASFTNWFVCNYTQTVNAFNKAIFRNYLNYPPFNHVVLGTATRSWCSTRESVANGIQYNGTAISAAGGVTVSQALLCRVFPLSDLGL